MTSWLPKHGTQPVLVIDFFLRASNKSIEMITTKAATGCASTTPVQPATCPTARTGKLHPMTIAELKINNADPHTQSKAAITRRSLNKHTYSQTLMNGIIYPDWVWWSTSRVPSLTSTSSDRVRVTGMTGLSLLPWTKRDRTKWSRSKSQLQAPVSGRRGS